MIALLLGYDVGKATIRPRYSSLGSAEVRYSSAVQADDNDLVGHICIDLAGSLAEQLVNPAPFNELIKDGSRSDWQTARKCARRINRRQAETLIDVLMEETNALVQEHRDAIIRVAAALRKHLTLDGAEIKRLMAVVS